MAEGNKWFNIRDMRETFDAYREQRQSDIDASDIRAHVRRLKQIPASDRDKKRELAAFFQSETGSQFSKEERHEAYNNLLGRERNSRQT
jgi:hypothetical protein